MFETASEPRLDRAASSRSFLAGDRTFDLVLVRKAPITPKEHGSVADVLARWGPRRWHFVSDLDISALDGFGRHRAWIRFNYAEPDLELSELANVAIVLDELFAAVPESEVLVRDPAGLFGMRDGRFVVAGGKSPRRLRSNWKLPPEARLASPTEFPASVHHHHPSLPEGEPELLDLLEVVARAGIGAASPEILRDVATRHRDLLCELALAGAWSAASCQLLATGDERERAIARGLLEAIGVPAAVGDDDDAEPPTGPVVVPEWPVVARAGKLVLDDPALAGTGGEGAATGQSEDDDLGTDDLLLLDEDALVPDSPLTRAVRLIVRDAEIRGTAGLSALPNFARRALEHLDGSDTELAGACLLLAEGIWPIRRIAGAIAHLDRAVRSHRPWPARALAVRALASSGVPDAVDILTSCAESDETGIAQEAVRCLGRMPGVSARSAVRRAASVDRTSAHAVGAMADAGDVGGFKRAVSLAGHDDDVVRRSVAHHIDRIGGKRALPVLDRMARTDAAWLVRLEAVAAIARIAPLSKLEELLGSRDVDVVARALRSAGSAGRAEILGKAMTMSRHKNSGVREAAADALGGLGLPLATPNLVSLLEDHDLGVISSAVEALRKCGDSRAVAPLRALARRRDFVGALAQQALRQGRALRLLPPDERVEVRAVATDVLDADARQRVSEAFAGTPIALVFSERSFRGSGTVAGDDAAGLHAMAAAISRADEIVHGLAWSVRDGSSAIRRAGDRWLVTGADGRVVRDAGWFPVSGRPESIERPELAPDPEQSASAAAAPPGTNGETLGIFLEEATATVSEEPPVAFFDHDERTPGRLAPQPPRPGLSKVDNAPDAPKATVSEWLEDTTQFQPEITPPRPQIQPSGPPPMVPDPSSTMYFSRVVGAPPAPVVPPAPQVPSASVVPTPPPAPLHDSPDVGGPAPDPVDEVDLEDDLIFDDEAEESGEPEVEVDDDDGAGSVPGPPDDPWVALLIADWQDHGLSMLMTDHPLVKEDAARLDSWLDSGDGTAMIAACRVIDAMGEPDCPNALVPLLTHPEGEVRLHAARALGAIGRNEHLPNLAPLCGDRDPTVRQAASDAIMLIHSSGRPPLS